MSLGSRIAKAQSISLSISDRSYLLFVLISCCVGSREDMDD